MACGCTKTTWSTLLLLLELPLNDRLQGEGFRARDSCDIKGQTISPSCAFGRWFAATLAPERANWWFFFCRTTAGKASDDARVEEGVDRRDWQVKTGGFVVGEERDALEVRCVATGRQAERSC
ncbi:hypothetical protein BKA81DRAFT_231499 [Phyllosticta paracitricarpa]